MKSLLFLLHFVSGLFPNMWFNCQFVICNNKQKGLYLCPVSRRTFGKANHSLVPDLKPLKVNLPRMTYLRSTTDHQPPLGTTSEVVPSFSSSCGFISP